MQVKSLIISIVITSLAMADEVPPELPFQASDGTSLTTQQAGFGDTVDNKQYKPSDNSVDSEVKVNGTTEKSLPTITPNPLESEQMIGKDPQAKSVAPEEKPKLKKRPKILDKIPEPLKEKGGVKKQELDLGLQSGITLRPKPGKTESVIIAKGKLNRIVTPYAAPKVLTVDNVETKVDGSVIYIASDSSTPVSLFISDTESVNAASLQLVPQELIAPVEIRIEGDPAKSAQAEEGTQKSDRIFRQDEPYIAEVKTLMQSLGKQQIPQGFTLEEVSDELRRRSYCHGTNLEYQPGQLLSGHDSRIVILIGKNSGKNTVTFEEAYCASEDTMAVAAWPKVRLEPGEKTEIYLLQRLPESSHSEEIRPALLK